MPPSCPEDGLLLGCGQPGHVDNWLARVLGGSSVLPLHLEQAWPSHHSQSNCRSPTHPTVLFSYSELVQPPP